MERQHQTDDNPWFQETATAVFMHRTTLPIAVGSVVPRAVLETIHH
jgi:hypothetical protein